MSYAELLSRKEIERGGGMTKKRFIKLLMSQGIQRNSARAIAKSYNDRKIPYKIAYRPYGFVKFIKDLCQAISTKMPKYFEKLVRERAIKNKLSEETGE